MTKVKSLGSATGMPEHLFYLANGQIKLLNMTDAKIDVSSKKIQKYSKNISKKKIKFGSKSRRRHLRT